MGKFMRMSDLSTLNSRHLEKLKAEIEKEIVKRRAADVLLAIQIDRRAGRQLNRNVEQYIYVLQRELQTGRLVFIEEALDILEAHVNIE